MKKTIELTPDEAQVLINMLNIATQAKGLDVAESCLFFTKKIQTAFKAEEEPTKD